MSLNNVTTKMTNIANKGQVQSWPEGNSVFIMEIAPCEVEKARDTYCKAFVELASVQSDIITMP